MTLEKSNLRVMLSGVIFGFDCLMNKQIVKGLCYFLSEAVLVFFMFNQGFYNLSRLLTLGTQEQGKIWNDELGVYQYVDGDRSLIILLYGIVTVALFILFVFIAKSSVESAIEIERFRSNGLHINSDTEEVHDLLDKRLEKSLLTLPVTGVLVFTVLPLVFMMAMAFTNYSVENQKLVLFDWVGLDNFRKVFSLKGSLGSTFWSVLLWTLFWALATTFINYFLGMGLAMLLNWKEIRFKKFWRFCFVLTIAVPHFVTLLLIRQMLQPEGAVNVLLRNLGWIGAKESLPFFTNVTWSRITVIVINAWVGIPYVLLQITGVLQNIPPELYEAAKIDGAGPVRTFFKITLPYMLFVTTPYLIVTFTGNVNNFNVIFLTSRGYPRAVESTAGKTDLLITWLYKLTIDNQYYNIGAVIGIMTFVTLSIVSLLTFHSSTSYKNENALK